MNETIVRKVPLAVLMLALACTLGCGRTPLTAPRHAGDDPAGDELLRDVLRRQGIEVQPLESSLATMPLPAEGERAAAVVVDAETTDLDDETREHLVAWVDAGGVLVLAGDPLSWPRAFGASLSTSTGPHEIVVERLLARAMPPPAGVDDADDDSESAIYARAREHGRLVSGLGLRLQNASEPVARFADGTTFAAVQPHGRGWVLAVASDELLTNVALARPGNAAALVALLSNTERTHVAIADTEDGTSPPSSPVSALLRAGLGTGLAHAVVFTVLLFLAAGTRLSRPRAAPPPRRRAFSEHVDAVGALYARTRNAAHALAAYARFADERLRARMPRGATDVPAFLASRARMPLAACRTVWHRAMQATQPPGAGAPGDRPGTDELAVLRELHALYAAAVAEDW